MEQLNITSAQYVKNHPNGSNTAVNATIDGVEMSVPMDPANRHYAEILRQVEAAH